MQKLIIRLLFILAGMAFANVYGQNITFNHLTTDNGLSQFSVNSLYIDESGILWIGTREGLNRYNGEDIKTYKLQKNDPNSLFCNTVLRIVGNRNGSIYLLCTDGVAEFNLITQKFTTLLQGSINSIYYNNGLFIGKKNEVYRYNEETANFDLYYQLPNGSLDIFCMHIDKGYLWIGTTTNGVYRLNIDKKELEHPIRKGNIISFYRDSGGELWIGSWEEGLFHVKTNGKIENFKYDAKNPHSLSSNFVRACCEDNLGNIWIGTFNGLNRYNKSTGLFQNHTANDIQSDGLTHSSIWCIVKDNQGTLWLGTYFGGVNYFNPEYEIYTRYSYSSNEKQGLSNPVVGRTIEDKNGNLWIGTEGGGLNYFNRRTREFKWYRPQEGRNSISHNNVKALYYDADKEIIWIGTHLGGLNRLDIRSGHFTHYRMEDNNRQTLPSDIVRDIIPYKDLLIVATQNGVCLFDPDSGKCRQLFKDSKEGKSIKMVADILLDSEGTLWIAATGEGVFNYRFDTRKLTNYRHDSANPNSLSNNNVNNIMQDSQGHLWFSTSGSGLDLYHPANNDFENFDKEKNGLASDCVYETQESAASGKLLLITNQGFSIFDYQNMHIKNYSAENGFPLTAVNENSLCITRDGEIFLGGVQGMISFHEMELNFTPKPYNIILSRLIVNGQEIHAGDKTGILQHSLCHTREITLNADQSMFSIEFATSNYIPANKDDIIYKLEGFSDEWTNTRGLHSITYTNLNAGTYTLLIKPEEKDESLCPQARLIIHILPPYYRTTFAYFIYLILTTAVLWYLIRTYKSRIKLQESLKYEQKHIQDVEALNQSKLRFFTNISHEFRTPLTMISGPVTQLCESPKIEGENKQLLYIVQRSVGRMLRLVNQLMDFNKLENDTLKLRVKRTDIISQLQRFVDIFRINANEKGIALNTYGLEDTFLMWLDVDKLDKIVGNLLSNALKFTPNGGKVELCFDVITREEAARLFTLTDKDIDTQYVKVAVADSGHGIPEEQLEKVFERYYQLDNQSKGTYNWGTGIGLYYARSLALLHHGYLKAGNRTEGSGAVFTLLLPVNDLSYTPEECTLPEEEQNKAFPIQTEEQYQLENTESIRQQKQTLLVVDDDTEVAHYLKALLSPVYNVVCRFDADSAFKAMSEEAPDLVLSDVVMPGRNGYDLCRQIKEDLQLCHIPVILVTAKATVENQVEGLNTGADAYVTKPFEPNYLLALIKSQLKNREKVRSLLSRSTQTDEIEENVLSPQNNTFMTELYHLMENELSNPELDVARMTELLKISRTKFYYKVKGLTGENPSVFFKTYKLNRAAKLIKEGKYTISEIADMTGFSTLSHFSTSFKKQFGATPSEYSK